MRNNTTKNIKIPVSQLHFSQLRPIYFLSSVYFFLSVSCCKVVDCVKYVQNTASLMEDNLWIMESYDSNKKLICKKPNMCLFVISFSCNKYHQHGMMKT